MAGVDLATVRELLGHKTLTMTLRYSHLALSHKVKAVDLLDSKLNEVCEKEVSGISGVPTFYKKIGKTNLITRCYKEK